MTVMARIFINYRRDDAPGVAGRLFDYLALRYSREELFMDVDAMKPGIDFAKQLDTQVSQCHVLLAVIGPRWLEAHDHAGHRRLDSDKDYVRIELASALKRDIAVIPVLVDGAVMPPEESLSEDLKPLARRHALELRHTRFNSDADAVVHALEAVVPRSWIPWRYVAPGAVAVAIAVAVIFVPKLIAKLRAPPPQIQTSASPAAPVPPQASASSPVLKPTAPVVLAPPAASAPPASASLPVLKPAPPVGLAPPAPAPAVTIASATAGLPPGTKLGEMLHGINLQGSTLRVVEIQQDDPVNCQVVCRTDSSCAAWTYVPPKTAGQPGRCLVKAVIPDQFPNVCCVSAIERAPDPQFREPPPVPATMAGVLRGIDLFAGDYRSFSGPQATPEACQAACKAESPCMAWSYVRPGVVGSEQRCFLKSKLPSEVHSTCCISGIERQNTASAAPAAAAPPSGNPVLQNTDLHGPSYRNFDLSTADPTLCQNACKAESQCQSWTYGHPSSPGSNPRCWLKNNVPLAVPNPCCTSGIERAEAK
jgi:PAN domain/TIR domain